MKKILTILVYLLIFIFSLLMFLPKESMYNLAENELSKKNIIISNEIQEEKLFGINISNANIFFQGLSIGKFENISISTYLFYSKIDIENISVLESFALIIPSPIKKITLEHTIFSFNKIKISSDGTYGILRGEYDIFTKILKLQLSITDEMKNKYSKILKNMKFENGEYIYEYKF